jgi:predicted site-specific integrase-resolvase
MERHVSIGQAAQMMGVSISTLRRWESAGRLASDRSSGGHRRYNLVELKPELSQGAWQNQQDTIAYACVSNSDRADDLQRQVQVLERYCVTQGWNFSVLTDSGANAADRKSGLKRLLDRLTCGRVERLVIMRRDLLWGLRAELVLSICQVQDVEVVIINIDKEHMTASAPQDDPNEDLSEIIAWCNCKLAGRGQSLHRPSNERQSAPVYAQQA